MLMTLCRTCDATNGWDALIIVMFMVICIGGPVALAFWMATHE
jgi:hypothetical protein